MEWNAMMTDQTATGFTDRPRRAGQQLVFRHSVWVRVTHWVWVVSLVVLFMSGLQIFNAHPSLNFGQTTTFDTRETGPNRLILNIDNDGAKGVTTILGHTFDTTGVLGVSRTADGLAARGFPSWVTIPGIQDLATGRRWHFLFAWILVINGLVYLAYGLLSGHIFGDLIPRLRDYRSIPHDIVEHLKLRFSHGPDAPQYNVLQKLAYASVLFVVLPVLILAGIEMSPGLDAVFPWLRDLFGGRQSARTIHFLMAWTLVAFVVVHVVMVVLSGPFNNMRSMITGRFAVRQDDTP
jgi:thiosulfate reductase cytochrome b subunit